jgi:hypothetical protein
VIRAKLIGRYEKLSEIATAVAGSALPAGAVAQALTSPIPHIHASLCIVFSFAEHDATRGRSFMPIARATGGGSPPGRAQHLHGGRA